MCLAGSIWVPHFASARSAPPPRASEGPALLAAAESAAAVLVGSVREPRRIDLHGWSAQLEVERSLLGNFEGGRQRIAWEELATERPARFAEGERALVALDPLPGHSLWRKRFPKGDARAVAARGRAFVRNPDAVTIARLAAYLALDPGLRGETAGVSALAALVAEAAPSLALGALDRLDQVAGLAGRLEPPARELLAAALANPSRPLPVRSGIAALAGARRLDALRPALLAAAEGDPALAAAAWDALASIDGGLGEARLAGLMGAGDPALREVAVRHGVGSGIEARLATAMREDPAASVRAAAVEAWVEARELAALDSAIAVLSDPDPSVQAAAARAIGQLGSAAVPKLRTYAAERSGRDAAGALAALGMAGPEGRAALLELAHSHADARTRALARLALGRGSDPH